MHPSLNVGGPATAGLGFVQEFVDDTKRLNIPVDFVSTHSYPSDPYCSRTPDPDCFAKKLLASREIAQKGGLPFMITEYKDGLQGGPGCAYGGKHGDMAYAAAFIIHVRAAAPLRLLPKSQTSHCADNSDANRARRLLLVDYQRCL